MVCKLPILLDLITMAAKGQELIKMPIKERWDSLGFFSTNIGAFYHLIHIQLCDAQQNQKSYI